jgi:Arc/MetJ-type ribon-helix-helix transcriptional regulator
MDQRHCAGRQTMTGSQKVTYQIASDVVLEVKEAVERGYAPSQSRFVEDAVRRRLAEVRSERLRESCRRAARDPAFLDDVGRVERVFDALEGAPDDAPDDESRQQRGDHA